MPEQIVATYSITRRRPDSSVVGRDETLEERHPVPPDLLAELRAIRESTTVHSEVYRKQIQELMDRDKADREAEVLKRVRTHVLETHVPGVHKKHSWREVLPHGFREGCDASFVGVRVTGE